MHYSDSISLGLQNNVVKSSGKTISTKIVLNRRAYDQSHILKFVIEFNQFFCHLFSNDLATDKMKSF